MLLPAVVSTIATFQLQIVALQPELVVTRTGTGQVTCHAVTLTVEHGGVRAAQALAPRRISNEDEEQDYGL